MVERPAQLMLLALLVMAASAVAFVALGAEVGRGRTDAFDQAVFDSLRDPQRDRPRGPAWLIESARDLTALGSQALLTLVALVVIGFTLLAGERRLAALVGLAALGGMFLDEGLKEVYGRPRPELAYLLGIRSMSFPSGHALAAAAMYLSLAAVLVARERRGLRRVYVVGVAVLLTMIVGWTRVYLGAHYPTDVMGGWLIGLAWAVLCALVTRAAQV